jgi:hypothetical protein
MPPPNRISSNEPNLVTTMVRISASKSSTNTTGKNTLTEKNMTNVPSKGSKSVTKTVDELKSEINPFHEEHQDVPATKTTERRGSYPTSSSTPNNG